MASNFPSTSVDTFAAVTDGVTTVLAAHQNDRGAAITAVQTKVGVDADARSAPTVEGRLKAQAARLVVSATAPTAPQDNDLWVDTSGSPSLLKRWVTSAWVVLASGHVLQSEGTPLAGEPAVNFGPAFTLTDNPSTATDVDLAFGTPTVALGTTASAGSADTPLRSDATLLAFDATAPSTQAVGDSATVGSAPTAARRDHKHALPAFGTTAGTITQGNDARLADTRTPTAHAITHVTFGQDPIPTFTTSTRGTVPPPGGSPSGTKYLNDVGAWVDPALTSGGMSDPMTTEDDLMVGDTPSGGVAAPKRLAKGTDNQALMVDPGDHHVKWRTLPAFGVGQDGVVTGPGSVIAGQFLASSGAWATPTSGLSNPMTTQDDLIVGGSSGTPARLAKGSDGQVLTVDPTTHHLVWANAASGFSNPMTTTGDLIKGGASGTPGRLAIGSTGDVLTVVAGAPAWAAPSGGGGGSGSLLWDPYGLAVPPVASSLSVHDNWSGSGIVTALDQCGDALVFKNPASAGAQQRSAFGATSSNPYAVPAPPYTATLCMIPNLAQINYWAAMLILRESSSDKRITFRMIYLSGVMTMDAVYWTDGSTASGSSFGSLNWLLGFPIWMRIRDTGSGRSWEYSKEGKWWSELTTSGSGAFCTPNQAGISMDSNGGGSGGLAAMTVLSLSVV